LSEERDDLDLSAFRYVAGEMTPAQAAAFETRLADDQVARDAVSRAVGLSQLVASAAPMADPPAPARRSALVWMQPLGWMAIGAAAAVLAVSVFSRPVARPNNPAPAMNAQPTGGRSPVDVLVWARLQSDQELTAAELERWLDEPVESSDVEEPSLNSEVPSWVLAAKRPVSRGVNP
jgi:hypothetical protein